MLRGHLVRRRAIARYLATTTEPIFHLGCGPVRLPGWLDSDVLGGEVYIDFTRRFPLRSESFALIFSEHAIEHISEEAGLRFVSECFRVLRPGGVLRLTTPDLRKLDR